MLRAVQFITYKTEKTPVLIHIHCLGYHRQHHLHTAMCSLATSMACNTQQLPPVMRTNHYSAAEGATWFAGLFPHPAARSHCRAGHWEQRPGGHLPTGFQEHGTTPGGTKTMDTGHPERQKCLWMAPGSLRCTQGMSSSSCLPAGPLPLPLGQAGGSSIPGPQKPSLKSVSPHRVQSILLLANAERKYTFC